MTENKIVHVVDDDADVRDSICALLDAEGLRRRGYASALQFLGVASEADGCAVLDIRMPGMDGMDLQARLKAGGVNLPLIFVTGHGDTQLAVKAMKAGALDFIEKPFSDTELIAAVRRALDVGAAQRERNQKRDGAEKMVAGLTPREREVLAELVDGHPNKIVAYHLKISPRTVEIHRANIMAKLEARNLSDLVRIALSAGVESTGGS
ncbi:MAG TPA: response regulator [Rhizomicrobium sp.]|jgi:two-component system response regulator FixJ|nr:response regulator [Rhizomicrobium sp.]